MKYPRKIYESEDVIIYLKKRDLTILYIKACRLLCGWWSSWLDFKKRKPLTDEIWSFRLNQKYRAYWYREWLDFIVTIISDHQ